MHYINPRLTLTLTTLLEVEAGRSVVTVLTCVLTARFWHRWLYS